MLSEERHRRIIELLQHRHAASITDLAHEVGVSPSTIARDLAAMSEKGLVRRIRGGASLSSGLAADTPAKIGMHRNVREKEAIAEVAAQLIGPGDVIFLEASTTVLMLARRLKSLKPLTVVTNDIFIAAEFADCPDIETIVTGGSLRRSTRALVGPATEAMLAAIHVDKVVMGVGAISLDRGLSTGSMVEAELKRLLLECGETVIGVADHGKFGKVAFSLVSPIDKLDVLITDDLAPQEELDAISDLGVTVYRATPTDSGSMTALSAERRT